jgi:PPOX class probable F420-dependent enzyme
MTEPMPEAVLAMLEKPNPAVIAVVRPDGSPASAAVWVLWEDGRLITSMSTKGRRRRDLEREPRVTVTVLDRDDWYRQVTVHGVVESLTEDTDFTDVDRISQHYDGRPYEDHTEPQTTARIRVVRWNSFGFSG